MDTAYQDIPRLYTALAEWAACMVYLLLLGRRFDKWKFWLCSAAALAVQVLLLVLTVDLPLVFWIPCMICAAGCMYFFLLGVGRTSLLGAGYCCARAFLLAEFAASIEWQLNTYLASTGVKAWWIEVILLFAVYGIVFLAAYFLERPLLSKDYLRQLTGRELVSAAGIVIVAFAFSNMSFVLSDSPFTSKIRADIFNIRTLVDLGGIAVLYAFQSRICEYMAEKEVASIQSMLRSQYDQYRNYQDSMEMIHIKYHDLKHQIAGLRAETDNEKRKEWLDAMERELQENELVDKTGNTVLDAMLGAKILQAKKNDVRITCVADGTLLKFMHVTDICTIFGNALDNALESVVMLPDAQKRLIHVSVSAQRNFVFIQVSNYCEGELKRGEGQIPKTTKRDKKNHGFGLKSIRYSVEKYGGSVSVDLKKNWFELRILIPKNMDAAEA